MRRRDLLTGTALSLLLATGAKARTIAGALPWARDAGEPPVPAKPGSWQFFTPEEGAAVEALVDRLIPPDPQWPGAKDAGVALFIDRQLAGPYGSARGLYMRPPFQDGTPQQGNQSPLTPAERYRQALAALDKYCRGAFAGKSFAALADAQKDRIIDGLEKGPLRLEGASGRAPATHRRTSSARTRRIARCRAACCKAGSRRTSPATSAGASAAGRTRTSSPICKAAITASPPPPDRCRR